MRVLVVDVANVMGSRPDGWWRDRRGAATRLLTELGELRPSDDGVRFDRVVAVVEGWARAAVGPVGIDLVKAPGIGDDSIVAVAQQVVQVGSVPVVVTADRGLRERLPAAAEVLGPRTLLDLLAEAGRARE